MDDIEFEKLSEELEKSLSLKQKLYLACHLMGDVPQYRDNTGQYVIYTNITDNDEDGYREMTEEDYEE